MSDHIAALEAALQAGPTDGPWITAGPSFGEPLPQYTNSIVVDSDDDSPEDVCSFRIGMREEQHEINAAYIAAANPAAIRAVLTELRDLREELAAEQARANMHADLGRRTAEALGLPPEEGRAHMPEVAKALQQQNEALLKDIDYFRRVMIQAGEQQDALRADAERLQWLLDHPLWSVSYRIRPGKAKEYRMREEGEYWGQWWPTGRQAIDKARAIKAAQAAKERNDAP